MTVAITNIGTANPRYQSTQLETANLIANAFPLKSAEKRLLKSIYKTTGIQTRYSVLNDFCKRVGEFEFFPNNPLEPFPSTAKRMAIYKEHALPLALKAISALNPFDKTRITHIITVSCTGMYAPGIDIEIVQYLKLNSEMKRTAINFMGCYGAFNGIKVAEAICKADANAVVLMVCVEICTIHFQKNFDLTNIVANAIFADGAAAIIVESNPTQKKYLSLESFYCDLLPQSSKEMAWHIADHGFDIVLSTYVPEVIETGIATFTKKLLEKSRVANIDFYAIHPGGIKILQACETALAISSSDNSASYEVLKNFGNMSSATILFVLKNIWEKLTCDEHKKNIFSCAFGPGLTLESMLLKIHCLS